jgi:hypothetical protein
MLRPQLKVEKAGNEHQSQNLLLASPRRLARSGCRKTEPRERLHAFNQPTGLTAPLVVEGSVSASVASLTGDWGWCSRTELSYEAT